MDKEKEDMKAAAALLREVLKDGRLAVTVVIHRNIAKVLYKLSRRAGKEKQIVHCIDCNWRGTKACFCKAPNDVKDDWFCSEGEKRK